MSDLETLLKQLYETGFVIGAGEITKKVLGVSPDDIEAIEATLVALDAQKVSLEAQITSLFADSARVERDAIKTSVKSLILNTPDCGYHEGINTALNEIIRLIEARGAEESTDGR